MTQIMMDVPEPVRVWYAEKAQEMQATGSRTTALELMTNVLLLYTVQAARPGGPGAFVAHDFPSGGGY